jgi:protein O-mannosyl-transferase
MTKRSRKKEKNISSRSGHFKSLNDVTHPLADEANKTRKIIICIFLILSTFSVYSQVQDHEFINYDDHTYITENLNVQAGLTGKSVKWAFTTFYASNWFPMTWLSHILDYQLYGLHPKGHYLTNLFLHISSVLILFIVLFRMTGALWQSGFVAAMFALHPINVQSVAWIAERKNVLSTLFWLITIWTYIRYAEKPSIKRYGFVFLFFALGLMSKPMLVTLPFVLLLLDYWPLGRLKLEQKRGDKKITEKHRGNKSEILRLVLEKIPLFLLVVLASIATIIAQKSGGALRPMDFISLSARLNNALFSYSLYLQKMIWPSGLSVFYPHPENALPFWQGFLSLSLLTLFTAVVIRLARRAPYLIVGWFWYLGTMFPVIGIIQVGGQAIADRYAYVPLIGIFIIIAWGLPELMAGWRYKKKALSILVGILIPALAIVTWTQVGYWKNTFTLFKHATTVVDNRYPGAALIYNNLGLSLYKKGQFSDSFAQYKIATKINPSYHEPYINIGNILLEQKKAEEAIDYFKRAIAFKPDSSTAYYNLGRALAQKGEKEETISFYKKAIKIKPDFAAAHYSLGNALLAEKKVEEAISYYKMAIEFKPEYFQAHNNLGNALAQKGDIREAINHYKETVRLKPDLVSARKNLEMALLRLEKYGHK